MTHEITLAQAMALADQDCPLPVLAGRALRLMRDRIREMETLPAADNAAIERLRYALKMYNESRTTMQSLASSVDDFLRDCVETSNPVIACECCSADFSGTEYGAACDGWRNGPDGWVCGQCLAYDQPPVVDEAVIRAALDECDVPLAYQSAIIAALTAALRGSGVQGGVPTEGD